MFMKLGRIRKATYTEVCEWILNFLNKIPKDMIKKAFLKAEISEFSQKSYGGFFTNFMCL